MTILLPALLLAMTGCIGCGDDESPRILEVSFPEDTHDPAGPFAVTAVVVDNRGVHEVNLLRTTDPGQPYKRDRLIEVAPDHFEITFGELSPGLTLYLVVEAVDTDGNRSEYPHPSLAGEVACRPDGDRCWYEFEVLGGI